MTWFSQLAWVLIAPLNLLFLVLLAGLISGYLGRHRLARILTTGAVSVFFIIGFTQLPDMMVAAWEKNHVTPTANISAPYGIIVLGGGMGSVPTDPGRYRLHDAGERAISGLALKRRFPSARLLMTGRDSMGRAEGESLKALATDLYGRLSANAIEVEGRSRSTRENALRVGEMLGEDRRKDWLLVTSALHMERALVTFRKRGFSVRPWPVDPVAGRIAFPYLATSPMRQFAKLTVMTKEVVGLMAYRLLD